MSVHPSGTVTSLFADIEASTRLWDEDAETMRQEVERPGALLRANIRANYGCVFSTGSDSFCAAFQRAAGVLAAHLDRFTDAAAMLGAVASFCEETGLKLAPVDQRDIDALDRATREALTDRELKSSFAHGANSNTDERIDHAFAVVRR